MRNLKISIIVLFLVVSVAFLAFFFYDRLAADYTPPVIVCDGVPLEVSIQATDRDFCKGLTATDNVDGDITDRIIVRKVSQLSSSDTATIYYAVFDSSSNLCTFSRSVRYTDYCKPHFSLVQPLSYNVSGTVTLEDRLTARDVLDGDITPKIRISSNAISVSEAGVYPLTVQVTNSSGDTSVATFRVRIENQTASHPVIELDQYLLYVPVGTRLTDGDLRSHITKAKESYIGSALNPESISIDNAVDTENVGNYFVDYSYTNANGYTTTVTVTVIVE